MNTEVVQEPVLLAPGIECSEFILAACLGSGKITHKKFRQGLIITNKRM
jgi:hypothetical protein